MIPSLVLASASPRRARILSDLGVTFRVSVSGAEETGLAGEGGIARVERLARAKAEAVSRTETLPVLAADTEVVTEGECLGKPASPQEARHMLERLGGRSHEVLTGVCLLHGTAAFTGVERTLVCFSPLTAAEIDWYVATGEPMDKAGAYHVDGRGALFIESIEGSPSNVAGLPIRLVLSLLRQAGLAGPAGLPVSERARAGGS